MHVKTVHTYAAMLGNERGMNIDNSARVLVYEYGRNDSEIACKHYKVDIFVFEIVAYRLIARGIVLVIGKREYSRLDIVFFCSLERIDTLFVGNYRNYSSVNFSVFYGVDNGLHIAAAARCENRYVLHIFRPDKMPKDIA